MQDTTAPLSPESPGMPKLPDGQGHLAARLGAAAVGPFGVEHYLSAFARLDAAGRALPQWNWAAALAGPAWLAFRSLWQGLAVYAVLALAAVAALVAAHAQTLLPGAVLAGVALALWLASAVALGLWGDALVHGDAQRRIEAAVARAATMQQAAQQLQSAAPTRRRMATIAVLLAAACALAVVTGLRWGGGGEPAQVAAQDAPQVTGAVTTLPSAPGRPAEAEAHRAEPPPAPAKVPGFDLDEVRAVQDETDAALAALQAQARAASVAAPPESPHAPQPPKRTKSAAAAPPEVKLRQLYINVGMFADRANADRVQQRLRKEGLPVSVDAHKSSGGKALRRVRVGPFTSAAQANEAAAKVRLLGLDAVPAAQ